MGEAVAVRASPSVVIHDPGHIGDIDTAEDPIDGMGAIKFTDEEDWGYFGKKIGISEKDLGVDANRN